jgi:hypothetical protein
MLKITASHTQQTREGLAIARPERVYSISRLSKEAILEGGQAY